MQAFLNRYIDLRIAASCAVGVAGLGSVLWLMKKSDVDILEDAAKVAKGG